MSFSHTGGLALSCICESASLPMVDGVSCLEFLTDDHRSINSYAPFTDFQESFRVSHHKVITAASNTDL